MRKVFIALGLIALNTLSFAHEFKFEYFKTEKGMPVVFYQTMSVPMLDIRLAFKAGSAYDEKNEGLSALTTRLLNQGNAGLNADEVAEALDETGAQFSADTSRDLILLSFRTLTENTALQHSLALFKKIVNQPDFTQEAFSHEQNQQLVAIQQINESPDELANQAFFKSLYGPHPYGHAIFGTQASVKKITPKIVKNFYTNYFVAQNGTLVLVGAISLEKAKEIANFITKDLSKGQAAKTIPLAQNLKNPKPVMIPYPASQTALRIGQLGMNHHSPHYFSLIVGNHILGGGALESLLFREIREKRGLTYGVYSQFSPLNGKGPFVISLSTKNASVNEAKKVTLTTLKTYMEKGPSEKDLEAAKSYLTGSFPLSLASNADIANTLLRVNFYQLPPSYLEDYIKNIQAVTRESVQKAFNALVEINDILEVQVGAM